MIELSIIILSYNTKELTVSCIEAILNEYKKELEEKNFEIIVVDNNSSDNSVSAIGKIPGVVNLKIILNKENLGFARGANIGAKTAKGSYLLFLNSDTEILDRNFLEMVKFLEHDEKAAILGGKLENSDGSAQASAGKFYTLFNLVIMLLGLERFGFLRSSPNKIKKVDWVSGACMMVRQDLFSKLSGFDEKLFMYMEDMELCFRAKKLGFLTYFYPDIKLRHKTLGSSNRTFAIINIYKGILHFYSKHKSSFEYSIAKTLLLTKSAILILIGILTLNSALRDRYVKAIRF